MNPNEPPPSMSSQAVGGHTITNPQSEVGSMAVDDYVQPMSISGHFPGPGSSFTYDNRGLNDSSGYNDGVKLLSISDMRQFGVSDTSGGGEYYPSDHPPSRKDVRELQPSQTGLSKTGNQITYAEAEAGMSLTAADFKRIDPNAFQKDN